MSTCESASQQPFRFDHLRGSPIRDTSGDGGSDCQPSPHQPPQGLRLQ